MNVQVKTARRVSRWVITAFLLFVLLPLECLAFSCDAIQGYSSENCCCASLSTASCKLGGHCNAPISGLQSGCCKVSLLGGLTQGVITAIDTSGKQKPLQLPPTDVPFSAAAFDLPSHYDNASVSPVFSYLHEGHSIYLVTGRLRL